jgi:sarcosine oxidase
VRGARRSADQHGLDYDLLNAADIRRRFPALCPADGMIGVHEPRAGILFAERCVGVLLDQAEKSGARLHTGAPLVGWHAERDSVRLQTAEASFEVDQVVFAAGPWLAGLLADLSLPLMVERNVVHWFAVSWHREWFTAEALPIFMIEDDAAHEAGHGARDSRRSRSAPADDPAQRASGTLLYGFPEVREVGEGIKVALHHGGSATAAESLDREVAPREIDAMRGIVRRFLPCLDGPWLRSCVCPYTNTPDGHFIVDRHPRERRVWIVSACSGHGFKFASAIGELVADLVLEGRSGFDLRPFQIGRFK